MAYSGVRSLLVLVVIATVQAQSVDQEILANAKSVIHSVKKAVKTQSYFRFLCCLCLKCNSCASLTNKVTNNDRVVYLIRNSTADKSFMNREITKSLTLFRGAASTVAWNVLSLNREEASRMMSAQEKISSTKLSSLQMRRFHPIKCWRHRMFLIACRLHATPNTVEEKLLERKKRANLAALKGMISSMRTTSLTKEETHRFISFSSTIGSVLLSIAALISLCLTCFSCILCRLYKNTKNEFMNAEEDARSAHYENDDTLNFHLNTSQGYSNVPPGTSPPLQSALVPRLRPPLQSALVPRLSPPFQSALVPRLSPHSPSKELHLSARGTSVLDEDENNLSPQIYSYAHDVALTVEASERDHYIQDRQQTPTRSDNLPHTYNNVHPQVRSDSRDKHGLMHSKSDLNHYPKTNTLKIGSYSDTCLQLHENTTSETCYGHVYSKLHQYQRNMQDNYNQVATTGQTILIIEETQCSKHDIDISYQVSGRESEIPLDIVEDTITQSESDYINSDLIDVIVADSCNYIDRPETEGFSKFKFCKRPIWKDKSSDFRSNDVVFITDDVNVNSHEIDVPPPSDTSNESHLNDVYAAIQSEHNERQVENDENNSRSSDLYVNSHLWKKNDETGLDSKRLIHVDVDDSIIGNSVESLSERSQNVYVCFDSLFLTKELQTKTILAQDKKKDIDEVTRAVGWRGLTHECERENRVTEKDLTEKDLSFELTSDMANTADNASVPYEGNNANDEYFSNSDLVAISTGNSFLVNCHDNLSIESEMNTKVTCEHKDYDQESDDDIYFNTDLLSKINRNRSFSPVALTSEDPSFKFNADAENDSDVATFACNYPNPKNSIVDHYKSGNDSKDLVKTYVETSTSHIESFSEEFDLNNKAFGDRYTFRTDLDHKSTRGNYCNINFATSSTENIFANNTSQSVQHSSETGNDSIVDNGKFTWVSDSPDDDCDYVNSDIFTKLNSPVQRSVMNNNDTALSCVDIFTKLNCPVQRGVMNNNDTSLYCVDASADGDSTSSVFVGSDDDVASDYYFNSDIYTKLKQDLTGIRHNVELDTDHEESLDKDYAVYMSNEYYFISDIITTLPQDRYSNRGKDSIEEQGSTDNRHNAELVENQKKFLDKDSNAKT